MISRNVTFPSCSFWVLPQGAMFFLGTSHEGGRVWSFRWHQNVSSSYTNPNWPSRTTGFFPGLWSYFFVSHPKSEWRRVEYKCSPNRPWFWLCGFTQSWNKSQNVGKSSTNISSWWKCENQTLFEATVSSVLPGTAWSPNQISSFTSFPSFPTT